MLVDRKKWRKKTKKTVKDDNKYVEMFPDYPPAQPNPAAR